MTTATETKHTNAQGLAKLPSIKTHFARTQGAGSNRV